MYSTIAWASLHGFGYVGNLAFILNFGKQVRPMLVFRKIMNFMEILLVFPNIYIHFF